MEQCVIDVYVQCVRAAGVPLGNNRRGLSKEGEVASMWSEISPRFVHKRAPQCVNGELIGVGWVTFRVGYSQEEIPRHAHRLPLLDEVKG